MSYKKRAAAPVLCLLFLALLLPQGSLAAGAPVIRMPDVYGMPGQTVTVDVVLENNPGVMALMLKLSYDHLRLTLTGAEGAALSGWDRSGDRLLWLGEKDHTDTGTILRLYFRIAETAAAGEASINLLCGEGDMANAAEQTLSPEICGGKIIIAAPATYDPADGASGADVPSLPEIPFKDVPADAYYRDAVAWAYGQGVTTGRSEDIFDPLSACSRGEVVTFLWRAAGRVKPGSTENPFTDVKESDYFYEPVLWAVENGITFGTDETHFTPGQTCSTAHIITFIYRALGIGEDGWYKAAGDWANGRGLLDGTRLLVDPNEDCPRSAVVLCLYRWSQQ